MESYRLLRRLIQASGYFCLTIASPIFCALLVWSIAAVQGAESRPAAKLPFEAEVVPTPSPEREVRPEGSEIDFNGTVDRIVDLARLLMIMCDEHPVPAPLLPEGTIFSMSGHLTAEGIDILERRLKDPQALALVRKLSPQLTQLLPVLAAGAPLVRDMQPEIQIVVARQEFGPQSIAIPRPILPAIAVVFKPKDISKSKQIMLSTFWAVIAAANEQAKAQGRSRLKLDSHKQGEAFIASARQMDAPSPDANDDELVRYNFTPAVAIVGDRFIISTGTKLGQDLVGLALAAPERTELASGPRVDVDVVAMSGLILDNIALDRSVGDGLRERIQSRAGRIADQLRQAADDAPERPRRLSNLVDRWRNRRLARRATL